MVALVIQAAAALVLLYAGASKLAQPEDIRKTIGALGLPGSPIVLAAALGVAELGAAALLVVVPASPVTSAVVLALGGAFAVAGALAMTRRVQVHCACLGPALSGRLGVRQLLSLPLWIAVAGAGVVDRTVPLAGDRLELLVVLAILVTLSAGVQLTSLVREHRTLYQTMDGS